MPIFGGIQSNIKGTFCGFEFSPFRQRVSSLPPATNAHRWAVPLQIVNQASFLILRNLLYPPFVIASKEKTMKRKLSLALWVVILMINGCARLATATPIPTDTSAPTDVPATTIVLPPTTTPTPIISREQVIEPQLGDEFWLKMGESVTLQKGGLTIQFKSLAGDSRCPEGVLCVWMGNAEVILEVSKNEITLNTLLDPTEEVVGDYIIQLRDVIPYPKAGVEYLPENYSIKIVVSKK